MPIVVRSLCGNPFRVANCPSNLVVDRWISFGFYPLHGYCQTNRQTIRNRLRHVDLDIPEDILRTVGCKRHGNWWVRWSLDIVQVMIHQKRLHIGTSWLSFHFHRSQHLRTGIIKQLEFGCVSLAAIQLDSGVELLHERSFLSGIIVNKCAENI